MYFILNLMYGKLYTYLILVIAIILPHINTVFETHIRQKLSKLISEL